MSPLEANAVVSKAGVIRLLARARAAVEVWSAGLSEEQRAAPATPERWGAKGTLAHIAHWNRALLTSLELHGQGKPVPWQWEDMDGQNARLLEESCTRPWAEVAAEAAQAYGALCGRLDRLSEADLQAPDDFAWQEAEPGPLWLTFIGNAYFHLLEHLAASYDEMGQPEQAAALRAEIDETDRMGQIL
jgi:hypothetical protein